MNRGKGHFGDRREAGFHADAGDQRRTVAWRTVGLAAALLAGTLLTATLLVNGSLAHR